MQDNTIENYQSAAITLHNNLRVISVNLDKNEEILGKSMMYGVLYESVNNCIRNAPKIKDVNDRIKAIVIVLDLLAKNFQDQLTLVFKGYKEGAKVGTGVNRTYTFHYEVEKFCREIEPRILRAA